MSARARGIRPDLGAEHARASRRKPPAVQRVLSEGGHQIDGAAIASFGQGLDFSRVPVLRSAVADGIRVHTGAAAAEAAAAADAEAFTVGSDIVLPHGAVGASSPTFRHELTHALQHLTGRSAGVNERGLEVEAERAESGPFPPFSAMPRPHTTDREAPVRRKPRRPPPENLALESTPPPKETHDLADELALMIALTAAKSKQSKLLALRSLWATAAKLISAPKKGAKPSRNSAFPDLYDPGMVAKLEALTAEERLALAGEVERRAIMHLQSHPLDELKKEFDQLNGTIKGAMGGAFLGWVAMRQGMFDCFVDIPQMNAYYAALVPAVFPSTKVKGHGTLVHPTMKAKLDRARDLIDKQPGLMAIVEKSLAANGLWATTIRENTARPSEIGSHAFGWAIDIEPGLNPDIRPFPEIFADVINADAGAGPSVMALRVRTSPTPTRSRMQPRCARPATTSWPPSRTGSPSSTPSAAISPAKAPGH
jgi:hypothetical protein